MVFSKFVAAMQKSIASMVSGETTLYTVKVDGDKLWNLYLDSFPENDNRVFRKRRENDCSACRRFVKSFGNVIAIKNGKIVTFWDFTVEDVGFQSVVNALRDLILSCEIENVFHTKELSFGIEKNVEVTPEGQTLTWNHLYAKIPSHFLVNLRGDTLGSVMGESRTLRDVFERSLTEITIDATETTLDLISQNSLYKGDEWKANLTKFLALQKAFKKLKNATDKDIFCWTKSREVGPVIAKIKNTSIGTFLSDLSEDMELDAALRRYEAVVAPANYKRSTAPVTKRMIEDAEKLIQSEGLYNSLGRRFATLDDIKVNNILFVDRTVSNRVSGGSVFDDMKASVGGSKKKELGKVEEITIDQFLSDVLPSATSLEVLLENTHSQNLVSLIAPKDEDAASLFKWPNPFSWAYKDNVTDSMKERVKAAGGKVDGVLRFSIQWNDNRDCNDDFDAHCREPNGGDHIYYGQKTGHKSTGMLDVDIIRPDDQCKNGPAVENITWTDINKMPEGEYVFYVNNFSDRGGKSGFSAEIEFNGQIFQFVWPHALKDGQNVEVARVRFSRKTGFEVVKSIPSTTASRKVWGLDTNQFHPVLVTMFSPNYWDEQDGIGHKHYFFMLKNCLNEDTPNGFFNEFLRNDFNKHRKVFEVLGNRMRVEESDEQLSGIGFSSTKRASLTVKVGGTFTRTLKINI